MMISYLSRCSHHSWKMSPTSTHRGATHERLYHAMVSLASIPLPPNGCSALLGRLSKDPVARPIPRDMLEHAWFSKASKKRVDMGQWIGEV